MRKTAGGTGKRAEKAARTPARSRQHPESFDPNILQPGFAGCLTPAEARFIEDRLLRSHLLRRRWGLEKQKSYAPTMLAARAFPEDPKAARASVRALLGVGVKKPTATPVRSPVSIRPTGRYASEAAKTRAAQTRRPAGGLQPGKQLGFRIYGPTLRSEARPPGNRTLHTRPRQREAAADQLALPF